jgi:hypothetical protein
MQQFLQSTPAQAVIWVAALLTLGSVGLYLIKSIRQWSDTEGESSPNELLTHFRGMHDEGDISQTEFKRIKSVLGGKLQHDLNSNDTDGDD